MRDVFIIGVGQLKVEKEGGYSLKELGGNAVKLALENASSPRVDALYVGNMLSGIVKNQQQLGSLIAGSAGLVGVAALGVEAACASGGAALHLGTLAIRSGLYDCVVVCGLEQMSRSTKEQIAHGLATASDWESEGSAGMTFISLNAKLMQAYMDYYGVTHDVFSGFGVNAHHNAMTNPYALFRKAISSADYLSAKIVEAPLCLYDVCPVCDGAAALVLASTDLLKTLPAGQPCARVLASSVVTDTLALNKRANLHLLNAVRRSSELAYKQAQMGPSDIHLFELHDAYSVISTLSLEGAGFAEPGQGVELARSGEIGLKGRVPISTFGGLKARGHPVGATGVYQCIEVFLQVTHQAKENQVPDAKIGMCQNIGGIGSTVVTHIVEGM